MNKIIKKYLSALMVTVLALSFIYVPNTPASAADTERKMTDYKWNGLDGVPEVAEGVSIVPGKRKSEPTPNCTETALEDIDKAIAKAIEKRVVSEKHYDGMKKSSTDYMDYIVDMESDIIAVQYDLSESDIYDIDPWKQKGYTTWYELKAGSMYRYQFTQMIDGEKKDVYGIKKPSLDTWSNHRFTWSKRRSGQAYDKGDAVIKINGTSYSCIVRTLIDSGSDSKEWATDDADTRMVAVDYFIGKDDGLIHYVIECKVREHTNYDLEDVLSYSFRPYVISYPDKTFTQVPDSVKAYTCYMGGEEVSEGGIKYESVAAYPTSYAKVSSVNGAKGSIKKLVIPQEVSFDGETLAIRKIDSKVFEKCTGLKTLNAKKTYNLIQYMLLSDKNYRDSIGLNKKTKILTSYKGGENGLKTKKISVLAGGQKDIGMEGIATSGSYSLNDKLVNITSDGKLLGRARGTAFVMAFIDGVEKVFRVTVNPVKKGYSERNRLYDYMIAEGLVDEEGFDVCYMPDYKWKDSEGITHEVHMETGMYRGSNIFISDTLQSITEDGDYINEVTKLYFTPDGYADLIYTVTVDDKEIAGKVLDGAGYEFICPISKISSVGEYNWTRIPTGYEYGYTTEIFTEEQKKQMCEKAAAGAYKSWNRYFKTKLKTNFTMKGLGCK